MANENQFIDSLGAELEALDGIHAQDIETGSGKKKAALGNYTNKLFPTISTIHAFPAGKIQAQLVKSKTDTGDINDKFYTIGLNPTEIILSSTEIITAGSCSTDINDWELLKVELIDDVANDGTGALVPFNDIYSIEKDGTKTLILTLDNKGLNYTVLGTKRTFEELGNTAKTSARATVLNGIGSWSPSVTTSVFSYYVVAVGNIATPPTFTDSSGNVTPLYEGENNIYEVLDDTINFDITNISIDTLAGDIVKISFSEIV